MSMIKLIYAKSLNNVLGANNAIPWHYPKDLEIFRNKTVNAYVVIGRKTYESLPEKFRPLPNRTNIVVSNNKNYRVDNEQVIVINDLFNFLYKRKLDRSPVDIWVIGGSEVLRVSAELADEIHMTVINEEVEGDVFAPPVPDNFLIHSKEVYYDQVAKHNFTVSVFHRKKGT